MSREGTELWTAVEERWIGRGGGGTGFWKAVEERSVGKSSEGTAPWTTVEERSFGKGGAVYDVRYKGGNKRCI